VTTPGGATDAPRGAGAKKTAAAIVTRDDALAAFLAEGCSAPRSWGNGPGDSYGTHDHGYHKVLFCLEGSIVFHTATGDVALDAGDRLDLRAGTEHAATVGPLGCSCIEATR
jgi:mannose-6-phosphate isomerase-like protein (cupin superfamily)